jgi:hypothetical protein
MTLRGPRRSCWTAQSTRSAAGRRPPRRARAARQGAPAGACAAVGGRKGEVARAAEFSVELGQALAGLGAAGNGGDGEGRAGQ